MPAVSHSRHNQSALGLLGTPELIRALPDPLFVYDADGNIVQVSDKACESVGYSRDEILQMNVVDLERSLDRPSARVGRSELRPGGCRIVYGRHRRKDGTHFPVEVHCGLLQREEVALYFASVRDVSRRRRDAAEAGGGYGLRAEADLQTILDQMPAMIGYWNRELYCEFANKAYTEWFGLSADRTVGLRMPELLGERIFELNRHHVEQALLGNRQRFERRLPKADGTPGIVDVQYIPDVDAAGSVRGFFVLVTEVTVLHDSFARNRELVTRLEAVREEERRAIAQTLHEGIAQDLFAIKLALVRTMRESTAGDTVGESLRALLPVIEKCMADTRSIADNLRPTAITHLRIAEAIREHASYFSQISGLKIQVAEDTSFPALGEDTQLVLYRATQEALTNVARHAQASRVDITLKADAAFLQLEVVDDGVGIGPGARLKSGSLGLLGVQEKFDALGGGLVIERREPRGTRFLARLPRSSG